MEPIPHDGEFIWEKVHIGVGVDIDTAAMRLLIKEN